MKITKKILENAIRAQIEEQSQTQKLNTDDHKLMTMLKNVQKVLGHLADQEMAVKTRALKKVLSSTIKALQDTGVPTGGGAPVNMRMTGGLDASLEEMVREELEKILEQGIDPVVDKPVSLGGQRISREEAFEAFEVELSKMHDPEVVSKFMEALEDRLSGA